ncbi:MAG: sialidase family protein [Pyrinomonadaceae bacterium]
MILSLGVLCLIFPASCRNVNETGRETKTFYRYRITPAEFDLGDREKFGFAILEFVSDKMGRLLVQYEKSDRSERNVLGRFIRISEDGGKTFGKEIELGGFWDSGESFSGFSFYFVGKRLAVAAFRDGNFFYSLSDENLENWTVPVQVNDEQSAYAGGLKLIQPDERRVFCVWMDKRRGFNLIFFSSSEDGGRNWSPNQPIEYDFREGPQIVRDFIAGADGRLLVFWEDWRDRKTLADIRCSYSDDGGISWVPSRKINDDEKEVWQLAPSVAVNGRNIYIVFGDFREEGEEGDNDWNIYFSRSTDNGITWEKNRRLNDIREGRDLSPGLEIDGRGRLYCSWWTTRETLLGQIAFSYSDDGGETWSPSITLTDPSEMYKDTVNPIISFSEDKLLINHVREEYGKSFLVYSFLEKMPERLESGAGAPKPEAENPAPLKFEIGETLFSDDFSGEKADNWQVGTGFWEIVGGTYMGISPNSKTPASFASFLKFEEPERYVLRGRFRLDQVAHTAANIYVRADRSGLRHYVITNNFRRGAWISLKNDDLPGGLHISGGTPLIQKRFPFKQNVWYEFSLAVTPERIDYYVDGRLMLSYQGKLVLPRGRMGVGGLWSSPTYFDDISVAELKQ